MAYADGKSSQTGLDGGNTSVGVNTGASYNPPQKINYTVVLVAALAVAALLIYTRKGR